MEAGEASAAPTGGANRKEQAAAPKDRRLTTPSQMCFELILFRVMSNNTGCQS
jgi:hypothetical protein